MSNDGKDNKSGKTRRRKPRSPHYKADNSGGFGNPPVKDQFREGGPPGPGRPRGITNLESAMAKVLQGPVPLKNGGSTDYWNALAISARDASLKKTVVASEFGFSLAKRFAPKDPEPTFDLGSFTDAEKKILSSLLDRALGQTPELPTSNPLNTKFETGEGYFAIKKGSDGHLYIRRIAELCDDVEVKHREMKT